MVDNESGDPKDWTEYKPDNQSLELCFDDIIITRSNLLRQLYFRTGSVLLSLRRNIVTHTRKHEK